MLLAAISVTVMLILGTLSIVGLVCDIEWMENLGNFGMAVIGGIAIFAALVILWTGALTQ